MSIIRLRGLIERGLRHGWLGPVVLILLAVLLAAVLIHEGERLTDGVGELCMALFVLVVLCGLARTAPDRGSRPAAPVRASAWTPFGGVTACAQPPPRTLPLRL